MTAGDGQRDLIPSGFFVLRTPLLPLSELTAWGEGLDAASHVGKPAALEEALARDRLRLRERLARAAARPELREAIFIASPSLDAGLDAWREDPETDRARTAEQSLVSYFSRATTRPTPFGLFAGCTTGVLGAATRLRLQSAGAHRRRSRLDMEYLWRLAEAIERDPALRAELVYRPNSSLYDVGDRLFFAEAVQAEEGRSYQLVAVDKTPYLMATLERARAGESLQGLAAALVDGDVGVTEAEAYVADLAESQILMSDAQPQLTGEQPTDVLIRTLAQRPGTTPLAERLDAARADLETLDCSGMGASPERYSELGARLEGLPASPSLSRLVQVDLAKAADEQLVIGPKVVEDIRRGVHALHALTRARPPEALARWREEFVRRYETREVPLAEALDEENGIGFERSASGSAEAAEFLGGLALGGSDEHVQRWTARDTLLLRKLTRALADGLPEITIEPDDLAALAGADVPPLPEAFEVLASLEATSEEDVDRGRFRVLVQSASGPSGARLLGRFCHMDAELEQLVLDHLRAEESLHPDRVYAEIVHLPEGRVGNILARPVLRDYEIPYLGRSGAPIDRQLPLSDLLVSVQDDMIVLRSRRLDREVVPRLTTAHNHAWRSLGVYRFLCALQHQAVVPGLTWDWGPLEGAPFLPRVVHGRALLARARWNLDRDDLAAFREQDADSRFARVAQLRADRGLPRLIALADADNELVADLENVLSVDALARQLKRRPAAKFVELMPAPERLCASGPEGRFTHQIVMPFVRSSPQPAPRTVARRPSATTPRSFAPGSEWLYLKLFTGTATADRVLGLVARAVHASLASQAADGWFFIRYGDPDWHLRVRVHGNPERLLLETLPAIRAATTELHQGGQLWRIELGTYEREVERYGGEHAIEHAERIFHADSEAVVSIMPQLRGDRGADLRWRAALAGIDRLLEDFGLTLDEKRAIAGRACEGYGREFGVGSDYRRQLGRRFRRHRAELEMLLDERGDLSGGLWAGLQAFAARTEVVAPAAAELRRLDEAGQLSVSIADVAMSCAHMHVNRLLRSAQRVQEYVLYELLDRMYASQAARQVT
jgi:thiopeptide-type bacteriocin biosynthesis protein